MPNSTDRTVHATLRNQDAEVVRYDRAGKWYVEPRDPDLRRRKRRHIALNEAVRLTVADGTWHEKLPGGLTFDARVRNALAERAQS